MSKSERVYRVDRFLVPAGARDEFLDRGRKTRAFLRALSGFVQDFVVEQQAGPDTSSIVSIAVWENAAAVENAQRAVQNQHAKENFDPRDFVMRLGIKAERGNYYEQVDAFSAAGAT